MNYKEYKGLDYAQVGKEILQFWKENQIFAKERLLLLFMKALLRPTVRLGFTT